MKYLKRQEGMISPLVIGLVAVIIIVVGVAVWQAQRAKPSPVTASPTPTPTHVAQASPTPTATPVPALLIKELGVKISLANGPADLSYTYEYNKDLSAATAQLGTAKCASGSLGELVKFTGVIPVSVKPYNSGTDLPMLLKQYNGYYLQHVPSQNSNCDNATVRQTVQAVNGLAILP